MAPKQSLLEQMRSNPRGDWQIDDVKKLCRQNGLIVSQPGGGSHFVISSSYVMGHQTVPARRPIKPIYIRQVVGLCDAHLRLKVIDEVRK